MQCEVAAARSGCASGGVALSGRQLACYKFHLSLLLCPSPQGRQLGAPSPLNAQMRQADDDDEGIEMGGTLDPEDGLQGIASKARPMPKW